ncbi:MAG: iron ABC transporter substrate-binding protein [Acidimicrobiales bacterium]
MRRDFKLAALLAGLALVATACGSDGETTQEPGSTTTTEVGGTLVVYSGRSEELIAPLIDEFEELTGIDVEIRYGDTAEMAAQILEEGSNSPADVYFGQDAGALGALAAEGRLIELDHDQLDLVPDGLKDDEGRWVGTSARARAVVYNTDALTEDDLPDSILDFTDPMWKGRLGWAPTNGSFQSFVTALRVLEGEDGARAWLEGIKANLPATFDGNSAIVEAVGAGEIDAGFVNHYYAFKAKAADSGLAVANKLFGGGDPGGLVNVAGVGILDTASNEGAAQAFVDFLLASEAQQYFADETFEVPLSAGVRPAAGVPTLEELTLPDLDLNQLDDLAGTLALLSELGIV